VTLLVGDWTYLRETTYIYSHWEMTWVIVIVTLLVGDMTYLRETTYIYSHWEMTWVIDIVTLLVGDVTYLRETTYIYSHREMTWVRVIVTLLVGDHVVTYVACLTLVSLRVNVCLSRVYARRTVVKWGDNPSPWVRIKNRLEKTKWRVDSRVWDVRRHARYTLTRHIFHLSGFWWRDNTCTWVKMWILKVSPHKYGSWTYQLATVYLANMIYKVTNPFE